MEFEKLTPGDLFAHPHPKLLELEREAEEEGIPLLSRESARAIYQLCALLNPRRVLDLGSGIGYSAGWLACAMESGEIHLSDYKESYLLKASQALEEISPNLLVRIFPGEATRFLQNSSNHYDLIFIDIDKVFYKDALDLSLKRLADRGLLIFDNACFSGRTFSDGNTKPRGTQKIRETIRTLGSLDLISHLWSVGDGLLVAFQNKSRQLGG